MLSLFDLNQEFTTMSCSKAFVGEYPPFWDGKISIFSAVKQRTYKKGILLIDDIIVVYEIDMITYDYHANRV